MNSHEQLRTYCKALRLPTLGEVLSDTLVRAEREAWSLESCLLHLLEQEVEGRRRRRIERLLLQSQLPPGKTLAQFDDNRLPVRIRRLLATLAQGDFVDRCQNVLFFGLPGTGKPQPTKYLYRYHVFSPTDGDCHRPAPRPMWANIASGRYYAKVISGALLRGLDSSLR